MDFEPLVLLDGAGGYNCSRATGQELTCAVILVEPRSLNQTLPWRQSRKLMLSSGNYDTTRVSSSAEQTQTSVQLVVRLACDSFHLFLQIPRQSAAVFLWTGLKHCISTHYDAVGKVFRTFVFHHWRAPNCCMCKKVWFWRGKSEICTTACQTSTWTDLVRLTNGGSAQQCIPLLL